MTRRATRRGVGTPLDTDKSWVGKTALPKKSDPTVADKARVSHD